MQAVHRDIYDDERYVAEQQHECFPLTVVWQELIWKVRVHTLSPMRRVSGIQFLVRAFPQK